MVRLGGVVVCLVIYLVIYVNVIGYYYFGSFVCFLGG